MMAVKQATILKTNLLIYLIFINENRRLNYTKFFYLDASNCENHINVIIFFSMHSENNLCAFHSQLLRKNVSTSLKSCIL